VDYQSASDSSSLTPEAQPPILESRPAEFRPLDPRVIRLWKVTSFTVSIILLVAAAISGRVVAATVPESAPWMVGAWLALAAVRAFVFVWYPSRAYRAWGYRMDERVLETRHGVWFKVIQLLPLSRLQHVDLHRGPLERWLDLASLVLHTAGTHEASIVIPGLEAEEAGRLRDQLVAAGGDDAV
jgi:membrane protein YdbS with pleckstrin-like domain